MGSHNHIIHAEVVGKDGAKIQQFFSELFGWSLDTNNPGGYGMSDPETTGVACGAGGTPDGSSGFATFYVAVDDVEAALQKVEAAGGTRVMGPETVMENIVVGMFTDPEGHVVGLVNPQM